jgi:hypothetical protein
MGHHLRISAEGREADLSLLLGIRDTEIPLSTNDGRHWAVDSSNREAPAGRDTATLDLIESGEGRWRYRASLDSADPARLILRLSVPGIHRVFHLLPGVVFGDNNLANMRRRRINYLTHATLDKAAGKAATAWSFRADRCAVPVAIMIGGGTVAALSVSPYSDTGATTFPGSPGFVRNGLGAGLADTRRPPSVSASLGYRNTPYWYNLKSDFRRPTEHVVRSGSMEGDLFLEPGEDHRAAHTVIDEVYQENRAAVDPRLARHEVIESIASAIYEHSYDEDSAELYEWFEEPGTQRYDHRGPAMEIAWTGGTAIAWPLLIAARRLGKTHWERAARSILDTVADPASINPASGFLWDYASLSLGRSIGGWWVHAAGPHHFAYTNGQALTFLLEAAHYLSQSGGSAPETWTSTPLKVLGSLLDREDQKERFAYAFSPENGDVVEPAGFAGCWFVPALARAYAITADRRFLEAARKSLATYHAEVRELRPFGAPMDTDLAPDSEGILAFIRAARLLHELTDDDAYLEMLDDGFRFEYLWRYGYRARPEQLPLRGSFWNSCGGSITSVANPTIHPMNVMTAGDAAYLIRRGGKAVHRERLEDQLNWACQTIALHPEVAGFGERGVINERYSVSDGFIVDRYADGMDSAIGFIFHPWAAACILEGLLSAGETVT